MQPSLVKQKALRLLARREHTRAELRAKLLRALTPRQGGDAALADTEAAAAERAVLPTWIDTALDELQAHGLLSDARAVQSLARQHAGRYGPARLAQTLKARGVADADRSVALAQAREGELADAQALWQRRFGDEPPPIDRLLAAKANAKQQRFLLQRGFSAEVVARVLRAARVTRYGTAHTLDD